MFLLNILFCMVSGGIFAMGVIGILTSFQLKDDDERKRRIYISVILFSVALMVYSIPQSLVNHAIINGLYSEQISEAPKDPFAEVTPANPNRERVEW